MRSTTQWQFKKRTRLKVQQFPAPSLITINQSGNTPILMLCLFMALLEPRSVEKKNKSLLAPRHLGKSVCKAYYRHIGIFYRICDLL